MSAFRGEADTSSVRFRLSHFKQQPLDICHHFSYSHCESRSVRDAIARVLSIVRSECGARGRTDTRRTRAASGIMQAGITTGRWGAATGLGQVWAGNARNNCVRCCPRKGERHRSAFLPRPRKPGLKSRAAGESPHVRTAVERRQASCPLHILPPCGGGHGGGQRPCQLHGRLEQASVGVPLPFLFGAASFRHCRA
jgi:hypothetical protein